MFEFFVFFFFWGGGVEVINGTCWLGESGCCSPVNGFSLEMFCV